jgi:aminoglycoside/choline kinase family phosphotransferase
VQWHLKVLDIFARLHHCDAKPKYLAETPRFVTYLEPVLSVYGELTPLHGLLKWHVRRRVQGGDPAPG